ncbi:glutaredoxin type i [Nannochloropsis gaditana CCMP526]|uniref:Glutaredoxin type i n=1 Tax=Nannochloropsis gaditana TaxID=72520 RepID=W7TBA2_9STRA|nr:glutaredoxin type i [Nannochloropsis gaditana CCMP526]EKU20909.1 glutaredoxin type i [Nannochloropsis gaditana CCMP526]EWM24375.1 glutaredoxin type i [Nannochloropsis gaditana]|eukprot:XP_005855450.1 glutaredoxin type i [Nannochloropsis gaditana CCMP526]
MKSFAAPIFLLAATLLQLAVATKCPSGLTCSGNSKEEAFLVDGITSNACFVVSKSYCPFCMRAKSTLASVGADCEIIELDQRADGPALQRVLADMTGRRTVPNVFIGGKSIGGADDTLLLHSKGELKRLLVSAKDL